MRVLVVFSSPPDLDPLRVDREDRVIVALERQFSENVVVDRLHAAELSDIHERLSAGDYDVVQFSGHGSADGIFLERSSDNRSELVSAGRVRSLIGLAPRPPKLAIFLSCYSHQSIGDLIESAPFVVTAEKRVGDAICIDFISGFYERLFDNYAIQASYDHAVRVLSAKGSPRDGIRLSRRSLIRRGDSVLISSTPDARRDTIEVNLDSVRDLLDSFDMSREELFHLLARKLTIHRWIFDSPRDRAIIPIGRALFGEFSWVNSNDAIRCNRLIMLCPSAPKEQWATWSRLLAAYNDLAACEYRSAAEPASDSELPLLESAVDLFAHHIERYLEPAGTVIDQLGLITAVPHLEFAKTHAVAAASQLSRHRLAQVVQSLELSLTSFHEVVDCLQPPEQEPGG